MFILMRALTYAALFIGLVLVLLPGQLLQWSGVTRAAGTGLPQIAGAGMVIVGMALAVSCVLAFALVGRGTPAPFDPPRRLVASGPYRIVRNPMYWGASLALGGAAVFYQSIILAGYALLFFTVSHLFVRWYEEPTLRGLFGPEYEAYCRRVGRWWPIRPGGPGGHPPVDGAGPGAARLDRDSREQHLSPRAARETQRDLITDHHDVSDTWDRGDPYEEYVGRWSRRVAPPFLSWLNVPAGRRWLDVGCGTGALCAAIVDHCAPSSAVGVEPSDGLLAVARRHLAGRVALHRGSATEIPLDASSVDVVVSGLVLNFVSEPRAALAEMARVTRRDGTIGAYVWDYSGKMELMRLFWDAAVDLDPDAARLDEANRFPLCRPEALTELFTHAGFAGVEVTAIDVPTPFASFEDYWRPFLGGQGPAPAYVMSLDEDSRARLRDHLRDRVPVGADGSISLTARAWAARAIRGK
jgi:protein-S-isoprenylcysteine O-methyltransferase Ste14/SAM-dependent methyltransferase